VKLKRLPTEWEKFFAGYTSDKRQITRISREVKKTKLNSQKITDPIKKWETELNKFFFKAQNGLKTHEKNVHQPWPQRKCKSKSP
jgi:hypothetical protein